MPTTDPRAHLTALTAYVSEQEAAHNAAADTIAELETEVAALKEENARLKGSPKPATKTAIRWGCSGDPAEIEKVAGRPVPIHRVFEPKADILGLEKKVRASHKVGRTEVQASLKSPGDWIDVPDAWCVDLAKMAARLKTDKIKTMISVNHEPEGGNEMGNTPDEPSGPKGFRVMYGRLVAAFKAQGVSDMLTMVLMGYDWAPGSGRNPEDWYVDGIAELGIDRYVRGAQFDPWTARNFQDILRFAKTRGLKIVLAEYGQMGLDTEDLRKVGAEKLRKFAQQVEADGTVRAVCYFHTTRNGGEPLTGAMLAAYADLVKASPQ